MEPTKKQIDEELLSRGVNPETGQKNTSSNNSGFVKSGLQSIYNFEKGALKGEGQALGDLGASAINWPISGIEKLIGKQLPRVPHPNLINNNPDSLGESIGQSAGQLVGGLALPGGAGLKTAQLANKGYQAIRAGKELPLIGKLLSAGAGGAVEGAFGNEENRGLGGLLGSIVGAAGYGLPAVINFGRSIRSKNIAKNIQNEVSKIGKYFNEVFTSHLQAGEEAGANRFLKSEKGNMKILKKAGEGKLVYGLEKFNESPTLMNAHNAQSDLNKIVTKYSRSKEGSLESDVYDEALKLKNRLLKQISESFEKSGAKEHGIGYQQGRVDYAKEAGPYLNSPAINALLGKNKRGIQTLRPKEFADKILGEEEFLSQAGKNHPDLLRREKYNKLKKSHLANTVAAGAAGATAAAFLPYEIRKLLGH